MSRSHAASMNLEGQDRNIFMQTFPHFGLPRVSSSVTKIEKEENENIFTVIISGNDIKPFKKMESLKLLTIEQIGTSQEYKIHVSNLLNNLNYALYSEQGGVHRIDLEKIDQAKYPTINELGIIQLTIISNNNKPSTIQRIETTVDSFKIERFFYAQIIDGQGFLHRIQLEPQTLTVTSDSPHESIKFIDSVCKTYFEKQEVEILKRLETKTFSLGTTVQFSTFSAPNSTISGYGANPEEKGDSSNPAANTQRDGGAKSPESRQSTTPMSSNSAAFMGSGRRTPKVYVGCGTNGCTIS
jgi:hypothetical protein